MNISHAWGYAVVAQPVRHDTPQPSGQSAVCKLPPSCRTVRRSELRTMKSALPVGLLVQGLKQLDASDTRAVEQASALSGKGRQPNAGTAQNSKFRITDENHKKRRYRTEKLV